MHTETMLLVDDNQCQAFKCHIFLKQRMRADDQLGLAIVQTLQYQLARLAFDFPQK